MYIGSIIIANKRKIKLNSFHNHNYNHNHESRTTNPQPKMSSAVEICYKIIVMKLRVSNYIIQELQYRVSRGYAVVPGLLQDVRTSFHEGHEGLEELKFLSEQNNGEGPHLIASAEAILMKLDMVIRGFEALALKRVLETVGDILMEIDEVIRDYKALQ
ncbi:hypothetical protein BGX38DRAFT_219853 [Terfezia claveryi]|nr:hypothetical protein BGX38DRAFT_219853 [Terfezia claveryi]